MAKSCCTNDATTGRSIDSSKRRFAWPRVVRASSIGGETTHAAVARSPVSVCGHDDELLEPTVDHRQVGPADAQLVLGPHRLAPVDQLLARLALGLVGEAGAQLGQQVGVAHAGGQHHEAGHDRHHVVAHLHLHVVDGLVGERDRTARPRPRRQRSSMPWRSSRQQRRRVDDHVGVDPEGRVAVEAAAGERSAAASSVWVTLERGVGPEPGAARRARRGGTTYQAGSTSKGTPLDSAHSRHQAAARRAGWIRFTSLPS